jgi:hypothetical protein
MTIERYVEQVPQTTDAVPKQLPIERSSGNFLLFQVSSALVTITLFFDGVREIFANVNGGIYVRRIRPWQNMRIDGPIGTSVTYFVGSETTTRDETDVRLQTAILAGVSATADQPASVVTDTPAVAAVAGVTTIVVPQNLARRRVTLSVDAGGGNAVFARCGAFVNNLLVMEPGMTYQFNGTYAISVNNPGAANINIYVFEES